MAILRAGPWWENGSIDPINPVTDPNGRPVNIARGDWPNQTWTARSLLTNEDINLNPITTWGTAALGEAVTVSSTFYLSEARLTFAYQATESFTITVDYESYVQDDDPGASFYWNYSTFSGSDDWFDTGGTTTRTQTVTLPATTLGFFSAGTLIYYPAQSTATVTIS
jgi:hypothetical protein|tara:strand:- start:467 stop:967 length:501 start_codon:yes stop_codon:yes gene_type:complete